VEPGAAAAGASAGWGRKRYTSELLAPGPGARAAEPRGVRPAAGGRLPAGIEECRGGWTRSRVGVRGRDRPRHQHTDLRELGAATARPSGDASAARSRPLLPGIAPRPAGTGLDRSAGHLRHHPG